MKNLLFITCFTLLSVTANAQQDKAYHRLDRESVFHCGAILSPPFYEYDANKKEIKGALRDMMDQAFKDIGWKVTYTDIPFGQQSVALQSDKVDAMCGDGPWAVNMIKYVNYSKPLFYVPMYTIIRKDEKRFHKLSDFNSPNVTFTGIDGDSSIDLAQRYFPKAKILSMPGNIDTTQLFMNVATRKADVVIWDPIMLQHFENNNPGLLRVLDKNKPVIVYPTQISVSKDEPKLFETINSLVEFMHNSKIIDDVLNKYDPDNLLLRVEKPYKN